MPSNLNLDYYYGNEAEQYGFYPRHQNDSHRPPVQGRVHRGYSGANWNPQWEFWRNRQNVNSYLTTMTLRDWKEVLLPQEVEALESFGYTMERYGDREISRDDVFTAIVDGGEDLYSTAQVKSIIFRVYGIQL